MHTSEMKVIFLLPTYYCYKSLRICLQLHNPPLDTILDVCCITVLRVGPVFICYPYEIIPHWQQMPQEQALSATER